MGLSLQLSFAFLIIAALLVALGYLIKRTGLKTRIDSFITLFIVAQIFMLIVAIGTKDPLLEGVPAELQLVFGGLSAAFGIWKAYLDPMKKRIGGLEVGQGEMKTDVSNIKAEVHSMKNKIGSLEVGVGEVRTDISNIKVDIHLIKEKLLGN